MKVEFFFSDGRKKMLDMAEPLPHVWQIFDPVGPEPTESDLALGRVPDAVRRTFHRVDYSNGRSEYRES